MMILDTCSSSFPLLTPFCLPIFTYIPQPRHNPVNILPHGLQGLERRPKMAGWPLANIAESYMRHALGQIDLGNRSHRIKLLVEGLAFYEVSLNGVGVIDGDYEGLDPAFAWGDIAGRVEG